jgi:hypothetical protein
MKTIIKLISQLFKDNKRKKKVCHDYVSDISDTRWLDK